MIIQGITCYRHGLLGVGWLRGGDRNEVSPYGCRSSGGGQSLLCSASAVESQDLPSGSECQVRDWAALVRYCEASESLDSLTWRLECEQLCFGEGIEDRESAMGEVMA